MAKQKAKAKIETLDDDFNVCESVATSYGTSSVIPSGNVRVTFSSGAMIDVYVAFDQLFVTGCKRDGHADEVLLVGGSNEGADFTITSR